ncbi:hypothetical protein GCM10023340_10770 [Nocardioides marinquilinus]|uniref:AfsR/SARP family transcriptional regulator n=1 Tax=Nocardioides marinquilinus TaxID=1210400 RepID=A0ABP9PGL4_9ACTN
MERVVSCRVLGVPQVEVGGAVVPLGSPLAVNAWCQLVAARGRRVSDDALVDALWEDEPPAAARGSLRVYVTRLRNAIDPQRHGVFTREHGGYRLPPELVDTDAARFEAACEQALALPADPAGAAARQAAVDAALALWTGTPYDGVPDRWHVADERTRLLDLHALMGRTRLQAMVDGGDAASAVPALTRRAADHPTDEAGHALLALALYRAGRQAEALDALRAARTLLADEWGLDPGPALTRLEARILQQDPDLDVVTGGGVAAPPTTGAATEEPTPDLVVRRSSLPAPLTSFVGRGAEQQRLRRLLDEHRLVTVVALGGTGKTRLALETATWMVADDGPWFVDLGGLHEPTLLAETVATSLDLVPGAGLPGLQQALAARDLLLVLDNCEHLADDVAAFADELLAACPGVRLLATSRVPLGVAGEQVLDLAPLDAGTEAVELFVARAAAAGAPASDLERRDVVEGVCRALDGHPLAVELAAGQCRLLTVTQVAEQLDDRFDLLREHRSGRGRATRGASLGAVVAWSVDRLEPADRDRFERLAVFDGGFDLAGAQAVCPGRGLVSGLLQLRDTGLLEVLDEPSGRRYRMLETLRAYAHETAAPEVLAEARDAHLRWVVDLARAAGAELRGPGSRAWADRLELEMPNVRTALRAAAEAGDGLAARTVVGELAWFWFRRGYVGEGLRWSGEALALPTADPDDEAGEASETAADDARSTARATLCHGLMSYLAGDLAKVAELSTGALEQARACGDATTEAFASAYMAYLMVFTGDAEQARALMAAAEQVAARAAVWSTADTLMLRGQLQRALGEPEAAVRTLEESARLAHEVGHDWCHGSALWNAGKVAFDAADYELAAERAAEAVRIQEAAGDLTSWLVCLLLLAASVGASGRQEQAAELLGAVRAHGTRIGFDPAAMDFLDSPAHLAAVHDGLDPDLLAAAERRGADLDIEEVAALVGRLVPAAA